MPSMRISGLTDRVEEALAAVERSPGTGWRSPIGAVHYDATRACGTSVRNVRNTWINQNLHQTISLHGKER